MAIKYFVNYQTKVVGEIKRKCISGTVFLGLMADALKSTEFLIFWIMVEKMDHNAFGFQIYSKAI